MAKHRAGGSASRSKSFGSTGRHRDRPSLFNPGRSRGLLPVEQILSRKGGLYAGARTR